MASLPRTTASGVHYHVIARCNNGERLLRSSEDCQRLLSLLRHYSRMHTCTLFNYVIMPSHIHLMVEPSGPAPLDRVMHDFCLAVARDYNRRHKRGGHFWRHRYRSHVIDDDRYALACLRYIHRNPVAAGLVQRAEDWPWSAYKCYALGKKDDLVVHHPSYYLLGRISSERQEEYRLFADIDTTASAERILFEGKGAPASRRSKKAYRDILASIGYHILRKRYDRNETVKWS